MYKDRYAAPKATHFKYLISTPGKYTKQSLNTYKSLDASEWLCSFCSLYSLITEMVKTVGETFQLYKRFCHAHFLKTWQAFILNALL